MNLWQCALFGFTVGLVSALIFYFALGMVIGWDRRRGGR